MKKLFVLLLAVILVLPLNVVSYASEVSTVKEQIIQHVVLVNQQLGVSMGESEISTLENTIDLAAQEYCNEYNITEVEAYSLILREIQQEVPVNDAPSTCATKSVSLPQANTGYIFFIDSDASWNHVGLYTAYNSIVEAMPEDGVQYWAYNALGARQDVVTKPSDGVNNSCILNVNTSDNNKKAAAKWPNDNAPKGTPYDFDFVDNKKDTYLKNVGTADLPVWETRSENDAFNCSELVWKAYKKNAGIDLDSNGGQGVYPNDIYNSSYTTISQGNWW